MENKVPQKVKTAPNLDVDTPNLNKGPPNLDEMVSKLFGSLPTWEEQINIKKELSNLKCSFKAKGHVGCTKTILEFNIIESISTSRNTDVFEVEDTVSKTRFAMKLNKTDKRKILLRNEINILTDLHDVEGDFVRCEHIFETTQKYIIIQQLFVMDFFDYLCNNYDRFSFKMARVFAKKLAKMIVILHKNDIIYTDLKLENIGIDQSGNLILFDFDLSYKIGTKKVIESYGSDKYMAPEQGKGEICKGSDVYALGSITWETLSLQAPNHIFLEKEGIDEKADPMFRVRAISEMKEDIKLEANSEDEKAALPFVEECIRVKVEDRIDLDKEGTDFENVVFLKDVTAEDEKEFRKEMLEYVKYVMEKRNGFLLLY